MMNDMYNVANHLFNSKSVALFMHVNPDWDSLGSAMALRSALRSKDVKCDIFALAPLSFHLNFLETDVIIYDEKSKAPAYDCYCAVDVSTADRLGEWEAFFTEHTDTVCIDHHILQDGFAKISLVQPKRCATGELIFELLSLYNIPITKQIAKYLYCAISSDSGSFQYSGVTKRTFEIVIALTETGIDTSELCSLMYERKTFNQLKLQGEAISTLTLYGEGKVATAKISSDTLKKYNASKSDTDFLAQLPRMLAGVEKSAFFTQLENGDIRVNLRAQGSFNIEPVARLFGGGGHRKAAGCTFVGYTLEEAEQKLVSELLKI